MRLVSRLDRARRRRWQKYVDITDLFGSRCDHRWERDRDQIDQSVMDPWDAR